MIEENRLNTGWISALDSEQRTILIADPHHADRERFVARADEKLAAFAELEATKTVRNNQ